MERLSMKDKLGYGSASLADSLSYNFIATYFMFFLTTAVGIRPATAGMITVIGAVWNGFINPVIGYFADHIRTSRGRRRPLILFSSIPLALTLLFAFTDFPFVSAEGKPFYYGILLMLFWLSYTGFLVPYLALASEYTTDYDQRTILRFFASMFNMAGALVNFLIPSVAVEWLQDAGVPLSLAWSLVGGMVGAVCFISILLTFLSSKKKDPPCADSGARPGFNPADVFREYVSLFTLGPIRQLIVASIATLICYSIMLADMVYFLTYNMKCTALQMSLFMSLRAVFGILLIPLVARLTVRFDKRGAFGLLSVIGIAGMAVLRMTGVGSTGGIICYMLMVTLCTAIYWSLMPSMYLDVCDYDRLKTGKRRQATIVSFQGLVEAVSGGIGTMLLGFLLQNAGFDGGAPVQTASACEWIFNCTTVIPGAFLAIAIIAVWRYPLTRSVHREIMEKIGETGE